MSVAVPSRLNAASLAALLDAVADAVLVFDSRGALHHANLAARQLGMPDAARSIDDLAALFGAEALAWLHRLRGTAPPQPVTQLARLGDERVVTLELSRLPGGLWSLRVRPLAGAAAPTAGDHAVDELLQWFDLSPVGMVMLDAEGLVVRSNRAFEALVGRVPVTVGDADAPLRELLAWPAEAHDAAQPLGGAVSERQTTLSLPDGSRRRVWARLRVIEAVGQRRLLAVVQDRSAEDERDLARLEIGALVDTAGVGVATFDESRGWLRSTAPRPAAGAGAASALDGLQAISRDLVDAASVPEYERLQRALKSGERAQVRYAVRHPELGLRWLLTRVEPGRLAGGRRTVSVVTLDVTEQERSREQLLLQAERTRAILDSVLVGIVTVQGGGIEWMNRSARRMFGGELADFVALPIDTVATPEPDHPLRRADWMQVLGEGQAETFECRLQARDGRAFWVVGNVVATGRQLTFALLDIERRRQAELRIAQAQASLERIIETAPMAIGLVDAASLHVLQLNQMAASFIGCSLDAAIGQPIDALFGPDDGAHLRDDLHDARSSDAVTRREYRRPGPGGTLRVWDARYVPLRGRGDAETESPSGQLLLVASDVTEQRAAEATQRDVLVKEVHHRIKNNLQGVAGLMQQIAERRPEVAPVIKEAVGQVQAIAQVYGLQVGASGPLRIRSVLEAIAASVQRMFGHPVIVEVRCGAPHRWALPEAESIPIALTVNELLTNAVKHGAADAVRCIFDCTDTQVRIVIANRGTLVPGFDFAQVRGGVSGLSLVRALLPRRHAALAIEAAGDEVHARITLSPPVITVLEPL